MDWISFAVGATVGFVLKVITDIRNGDKCPRCGNDLFWNSYDDLECPKCGYYRKG